jgi:hypothetical protein
MVRGSLPKESEGCWAIEASRDRTTGRAVDVFKAFLWCV